MKNRVNMSRYSISIGTEIFPSKSKALEHYKLILNAYSAGEMLKKSDFQSVRNLVYKELSIEDIYDYEIETGNYLKFIEVDYHPEFKNTKCFFLVVGSNEEKEIFSYRYAINGVPSDSQRFSNACRFLVAGRLREFKKQLFKHRPVKCSITNKTVEWEECQIDHKAPLTFSVIIKSFIIANNVDVSRIEYVSECTKEQFKDKVLSEKFDLFHKEMAVLRVLETKENIKLSSSARIKPTRKDGVLS